MLSTVKYCLSSLNLEGETLINIEGSMEGLTREDVE